MNHGGIYKLSQLGRMRIVVTFEQRMAVPSPTWLRLTWEGITSYITISVGGKIGHWLEGSIGFVEHRWTRCNYPRGQLCTWHRAWVPVVRNTQKKICLSAYSDAAEQRLHGGQTTDVWDLTLESEYDPAHELKPKGQHCTSASSHPLTHTVPDVIERHTQYAS